MKGVIIIRVITENLAEELVLLPAPVKAPSVDNEQQRAYNTFCNSLACQDEEVFIMTSPIEVNVTLYERNGVWTARGDYVNPVTGKRCRPSKSLNLKVADNTKRKAQRILPEIKAQWEQELNANIVSDNPTFGQSVRLWLEAKSKSLKGNTKQNYTYSADRYIIPMLGNIKIRDIKYADFQRYCDTLAETLKSDTIKKHFAVINGTMKDAMRKGIIDSNPASLVQMPREKEKFHGKALTGEQAKAFIKAAEDAGEPAYTVIILAMVYGLRRSEICGLRWQDIDLESKTLHVCNTRVRTRDYCIEEERTKTARSDRVIALMEFTIPHFKSLKDQQAAAGLKTDKVCCHADGRDVSPEYVSRIVPKLSKSCGLPRVGAHDMRRTAASLLIAKGATAQQAQEFLGHEDITTTMNIYTRCFNETKRHTSEIMNSIYAD